MGVEILMITIKLETSKGILMEYISDVLPRPEDRFNLDGGKYFVVYPGDHTNWKKGKDRMEATVHGYILDITKGFSDIF